jgi:hypothetical protein
MLAEAVNALAVEAAVDRRRLGWLECPALNGLKVLLTTAFPPPAQAKEGQDACGSFLTPALAR